MDTYIGTNEKGLGRHLNGRTGRVTLVNNNGRVVGRDPDAKRNEKGEWVDGTGRVVGRVPA